MNLITFPNNWFDLVESSIIKQYELLKVKGDIDNSVLAGFILMNSEDNSLSVISLATGTKLMSGDQRQKTAKIGPALIHDCHAEILSHRGLQAWIWKNLNNNEIFERNDNKFKLLPHLSIHFYSSDPPCGDCCVHTNIQNYAIQKCEPSQQDIEESDQIDPNETNPILVTVQTGAKPFGWDQSQLFTSPPNIVRGKPGRGSRSQSVSCSDKICLWINVGLQGSLLSPFLPDFQLSSIVIGNGNLETLHRALIERVSPIHQDESSEVQIEPKLGDDIENETLKIFAGKPNWEQKNMSPSASSFVWWSGSPKGGEQIAAKFGRKLGVTEKKQEDPRMFCEICDAFMLRNYCKFSGIPKISFGEAKKRCGEYTERKNKIKSILESYGGQWATKFPEEKEWVYSD